MRLPHDVHLEAKLEATRRGLSVKDYVAEVLRKVLGIKRKAA